VQFADQGGLFSYVSPEARSAREPSAAEYPGAGAGCIGRFEPQLGEAYASEGRPSIPPEQLLSACCCRCFTAFGRNAH